MIPDKQTVIADLAAAADELHRSAAGHPNVVKAIEGAIAHLNSDVIDPVENEKAVVKATEDRDAVRVANVAKAGTGGDVSVVAAKPYSPLSVDPDKSRTPVV